ncbi:MAG: glycosyltransferase [Spirochaetia bacterium]|nr:glycosyltransferase [Spirochaetia bacterium]
MNPRISIIVPIYNVEKYIYRCVDSILSQTFTDFECILIDDGSTDNCSVICDEYAKKDTRIKVIHQKNSGVSAARNAGLDAAKGEYITFVDSDDWVNLNFLQEQYADIKNNNADISICGLVGKKKIKKSRLVNSNDAQKLLFKKNGMGGFCFLRLIKKQFIGDTRFNTDISYMEDCDFFYRLLEKPSTTVWTDKPLYNYFSNETSVTNQIGITRQVFTAINFLTKLKESASDKKLKKIIVLNLLRFYFDLAMGIVNFGKTDDEDFVKIIDMLKNNYATIFFSYEFTLLQKNILILLFLNPEIYKKLRKSIRRMI